MNTIIGTWQRHGIKMTIKKDTIKTSVYDVLADSMRTLNHDYLMEANRLQLYSPTVREVKHAFKGELRIVALSPDEMILESEGQITEWKRGG